MLRKLQRESAAFQNIAVGRGFSSERLRGTSVSLNGLGLDASVFCNCYETGKTRCAPPQPELVYVDDVGQVQFKWDAPRADQRRFYDWLANACEHGPMGQLVSHRLDKYPVLLAKVVYNGTHGGDHLSEHDARELVPEIGALRLVRCGNPEEQELLRGFAAQMAELVTASIAIGKPIVF